MNPIPKRSAFAITMVVLSISWIVAISQTPVAAQGAGATRGSDQKVENVFMNIKALTGEPAELLNPTMVLFEAALGVGCGFCHDADANKRELDTKPQKNTARRMIEMVNAINKNTFGGAKQVTCFTCHMGRSTPIATPNVIGEQLPPALGEDFLASLPPPASVPAVSATQVLDKYLAALGGPAALQKVSSVTAVGTMTQHRPGREFPANQIEISSKAPGQNENLLAYDPKGGWAKAGNTNPRDLRKAEFDATRLEDPFNLPSHLKQMLMEPKMERPEVIGGREVYVISGRTLNLPLVKAYFEKESGMLTRLVYYVDTSFGRYPTRIEYGDFRNLDGRKVPYQWVISQTRNRQFTYAMQAVRSAAVDDSKFARPTPSSR
jgi:hypothetical protein